AYGKINDGGGDVPHVHGIIDQSADFARSELIGRLVLRGDGAKARVAALCPPQPEHQNEGDDGNEERPIALEIEKESVGARGFADGAFVEGDGEGEPLVNTKGSGGVDVHAGADDFGGGVAAGGAEGASEDVGADVGSGGRENDVRASGVNGDVPEVAGDVPVELVVVVEKAQGVADDVINDDRLSGIVRVGNKDFEFTVLAFTAGLEFQLVAVAVGDAADIEKEAVVQAAGADIFNGDGAVDAVPGATLELEGDVFGHVHLGVGSD